MNYKFGVLKSGTTKSGNMTTNPCRVIIPDVSRTHKTIIPQSPTSKQMMKAIENSGVLDFWDNSDEDVYSK